jgi:hypothetical protein
MYLIETEGYFVNKVQLDSIATLLWMEQYVTAVFGPASRLLAEARVQRSWREACLRPVEVPSGQLRWRAETVLLAASFWHDMKGTLYQ